MLAIKNNGTYDGEGESRDMKILIAILKGLDYTEEAESRIEELFIEWLHQRSSIKVLEGVPPLSFTSKGKPLTAWSITGNTVQNGTPTPDTPQEVKAVGDRTENLFDKTQPTTTTNKYLLSNGEESSSSSGWAVSTYIPVNGEYVTISGVGGNSPSICAYDSNMQFVRGKNYAGTNITTINISECSYIRFSYVTSVQGNTAMLNYGSTALPYEPYGYKIPVVTSADGTEPITTPIYLQTPLYSGDVLRSDGTITRSDGTAETFTAPQIPTLNGTTVIDVDTTVKPSNVYIEYK